MRECPVNLLGSQRVRPPWEWCEAVSTSESSGSFWSALARTADTIGTAFNYRYETGTTILADAVDTRLPDRQLAYGSQTLPTMRLSRTLVLQTSSSSGLSVLWRENLTLRDPFDPNNSLTPKTQEIVEDTKAKVDGQSKDQSFFETRMARTFLEGRRVLKERLDWVSGIAHKTTEGWEALLAGLIRGGWTITGSWPIATEMAHRPRARDSAALATSVHLICRPRPEDAPVGDWADVLSELPTRVADWTQRLQGEGVRERTLCSPASACAGDIQPLPCRGDSRGPAVELPEYLEKGLGGRGARGPGAGVGDGGGAGPQRRGGCAGGGLPPDGAVPLDYAEHLGRRVLGKRGRLPATERTKRHAGDRPAYSLPFDVTRRFAQPLGIHLDDWESRIIKTEKGVVRLLSVSERGKQLFGEAGAETVADEMEVVANVSPQLSSVPLKKPQGSGRARRRGRSSTPTDGNTELTLSATTLDRVHAAMLLQASGRSQALRNLLRAEQERGPDFLRLAKRPHRPLPPRQRGEATARRHASRGSEIIGRPMHQGGKR